MGANAPHAERHWRPIIPSRNIYVERQGANAPHAERHWRPDSPAILPIAPPPTGANAPHAERHWRRQTAIPTAGIAGDGANAPHAERHWRLAGRRDQSLQLFGFRGERPSRRKALETASGGRTFYVEAKTGANAPHAERHWRPGASNTLSARALSAGGERPSRRKALETRRVKYLECPCAKCGGRTPLTPKGIGDLAFLFCAYQLRRIRGERPSRRKALETMDFFFGSRISFFLGANAPHAERHWRRGGVFTARQYLWKRGERPSRRKALETEFHFLPFCLVFLGRTPLTPKGIGDSDPCCLFLGSDPRGERPSRRKALETRGVHERIPRSEYSWGERPSRRKALETRFE